MGKDTPRYFVTIKGSHYWQPSSELRDAGWKSLPLGKDRGRAVAAAVMENDKVDAWTKAGKPSLGPSVPGRAASTRGSVNDLLDHFQQRDKKYPTNKHTRRQYDGACDYLRKWLGPLPAKAVTPRMCELRYNALCDKAPAQAAAIMRVARRAFGRARFYADPGHPLHIGINDNPFRELDLKGSDSEGRLWTREERDAMVRAAFSSNIAPYPSIGLAIGINWWLAQREADILALPANALDAGWLQVDQNKTAARVHLPIGIIPEIAELLAAYREALKVRGLASLTHLLINERTGQPWDEHAFRKAFREVRDAAGCSEDLQFMHLRHTGVVNLEEAEATIPEIVSISGHTLQSATTILERYGRRTRKQAENAIRKRIAMEEKDGS